MPVDFKRLADKARQLLGQHPQQTDEGVKKAGDFADKKTGGSHSEQIQQGEQRADSYLTGQQGQGGGQQGGQQAQGQSQGQDQGQGQGGGGQ